MQPTNYPRGMTLMEALLAAVVMAMTAGAVIMPYAAGARCTLQNARQTLAVNLAQEMMEEILTLPFRDPEGDEAGETGRSTWDDIDDYHGCAEAAGDVRSFDGVVAEDPATVGLSRHVTVESVYVSGQTPEDSPSFLRVAVEVRYKGSPVATVCRLVYANDE